MPPTAAHALWMAWGFMPARIRGSLGPDTTQLLLGLVAGLVQGMQQKRKARSNAATPATPTPGTATPATATPVREGPGPSVKEEAPLSPGVRAGQ